MGEKEMVDKILDKGGYFAVGGQVYQVKQKEDGGLVAQGYSPTKGHVPADGWEVLLAGEAITEKEYKEHIAWIKSRQVLKKEQSSR